MQWVSRRGSTEPSIPYRESEGIFLVASMCPSWFWPALGASLAADQRGR